MMRASAGETRVRIDLQGSVMDRHCPGVPKRQKACEYTCDLYPQFCQTEADVDMGVSTNDSDISGDPNSSEPNSESSNTSRANTSGCHAIETPTRNGALLGVLLLLTLMRPKRSKV